MSGRFRLGELVPWRELEIETRLEPDVATGRIERSLESGAFVGERIGAGQFEIRRVIAYKNSFLPIIRVSIAERRLEGAVVTIGMRLAIPVMLFMLVWLGGASLGGLVALFAGIHDGDAVTALFGLLPVIGFGIMGGGFALEARRAEALLREMLPELT